MSQISWLIGYLQYGTSTGIKEYLLLIKFILWDESIIIIGMESYYYVRKYLCFL